MGSGWAWERWAKLNVVQKRWLCAVGCTSFNFAKRWQSLSVDVVSERSNAITDNGLQLGEVADLEALTFNLALNFI